LNLDFTFSFYHSARENVKLKLLVFLSLPVQYI